MDKAEWRAMLLGRRRDRPRAEIAVARRRLAEHLLPLAIPGATVCAYLPLPTEPLDPDLPAVLAGRGARVLVPVATPAAPLDWCVWSSEGIRRGGFGIPEPTGPRLGADAIGAADVVLIPALAVDRHGVRLGRGGGHYDRSLALLDRHAPGGGPVRRPRLIAVIFDDELVDVLPSDTLDRRVTETATPAGGIQPCPVASGRAAGASSD